MGRIICYAGSTFRPKLISPFRPPPLKMSLIDKHIYMRDFIIVMLNDDTLDGTGLEIVYKEQWKQLKKNVDNVMKTLIESIYKKDRTLFLQTSYLANINLCQFEEYTGNHLSKKSS
jgi:hypothetical protein